MSDREGDVDSDVSTDKVNDTQSIRTASSDGDLQATKHGADSPGKARLFGRQKPVHAALGGGKRTFLYHTLASLYSCELLWVRYESILCAQLRILYCGGTSKFQQELLLVQLLYGFCLNG